MMYRVFFLTLILLTACGPTHANTTWNASDKDSAITLGSWAGQSNLYAEQSSASASYRMVRSTTSKSSGKFYFEVVVTQKDTGNSGNLIGVSNSTQALNNFVGSTNNSLGFKADGTVFKNGGTVTGSVSCTPSNLSVMGIAVDLTNNRIWCTVDGSTWGHCSGCATGDPSTAATGYDIASVNTGSVFIGWAGQDNSSADSVILNVGNYGPFQFSIPSGYSGWDSSGTTLTNLSGTGTFIAAASGAYDSSGSSTSITLSNGNLTAASAALSKTAVGSFSDDIKITGKRYFEVKLDTVVGAVQDLGIASPIFPGNTQGGTDAYGWSYVFSNSNGGVSKNTIIYTITTHLCGMSTGVYVGIAVDLGAGKIWCTGDGTNYSNGDNPTSGTGGMTLVAAHLGYGAVPIVTLSSGDQATINLGATTFHFTAPTSFTAWDGTGQGGGANGVNSLLLLNLGQ